MSTNKKNKTTPKKKPPNNLTTKKTKQASKDTVKNNKFSSIKLEIISLLVFVLAVFVYISITKFKGIPDDIQFIGLFGTSLMKGMEFILGDAALYISFFLLFWAIHIGIQKEIWSIHMWGISIILITAIVAIGIYTIPGGMDPWQAGQKGMGGGYLGGLLAFALVKLLGKVGSLILLILSGIIGLLMVVNKPLKDIWEVVFIIISKLKEKFASFIFYPPEEEEVKQAKSADDSVSEAIIINKPVFEDFLPSISTNKDTNVELLPLVNSARAEDYKPINDGDDLEQDTNSNQVGDKNLDYQKPPLELLSDFKSKRTLDKKNIKESIAVLEDTFSSFGISVKVNQVSCGPAVTRYELTPAPGVKVSKIISLTDDLQLNLAAPGIRIEAPIPGKSAIGIEVPNNKVSGVGLKNLLQSSNFSQLNTPLAFALGEDIAGNTVVARLNDMPHLLIAGSTGSGKSVCLNSIIMSLLYNSSPEEMKLVFIDPKMVELTVYNGIPHLLTPVVTNTKKAAVVLRWMVTEMEKRYRLFAEKGVRDIARYNQSSDEPMPYIVIVIDELADLMMVAPIEVEDSICRLAQMARAAGMHLIVATQRPSVDVVTGIIKANIPSRIAFAVSSQTDSRTILDMGGAEKLLGKGDMLFFPVGAVKPYRVQGAYVSDSDIEKTVDFIKKQATEPVSTTEQLEEIEASFIEAQEFEEDELFWDAVTVFVEGQKASVSLLQRRLRIGYARAARLVDLMEDKGIVSELDNNRKREILIDNEQLERLYDKQKLC